MQSPGTVLLTTEEELAHSLKTKELINELSNNSLTKDLLVQKLTEADNEVNIQLRHLASLHGADSGKHQEYASLHLAEITTLKNLVQSHLFQLQPKSSYGAFEVSDSPIPAESQESQAAAQTRETGGIYIPFTNHF